MVGAGVPDKDYRWECIGVAVKVEVKPFENMVIGRPEGLAGVFDRGYFLEGVASGGVACAHIMLLWGRYICL